VYKKRRKVDSKNTTAQSDWKIPAHYLNEQWPSGVFDLSSRSFNKKGKFKVAL